MYRINNNLATYGIGEKESHPPSNTLIAMSERLMDLGL
jgi:hypothetical protein